jgi:Cu/Ag efflux pump CusA
LYFVRFCAEAQKPLATTVIGRLATLLTLFVLPAICGADAEEKHRWWDGEMPSK